MLLNQNKITHCSKIAIFLEIPHFLPDYVVQAGVQNDRWSQEAGMGNKGGCAALVPHPTFLPMSVIPIGASRKEPARPERAGNLIINFF
jgi:hypothetical protein